MYALGYVPGYETRLFGSYPGRYPGMIPPEYIPYYVVILNTYIVDI